MGKVNLFRKGSIFLTFFGSCLALGLVVTALGTKWYGMCNVHFILFN